MERYLYSTAGVLFLGMLAAFLLFVPLLSLASVIFIIFGLAVMFWLGFRVGRRTWPRRNRSHERAEFSGLRP
jgi:hypothetical protein